MEPPDGEHARRVAASDEDQVLVEDKLAQARRRDAEQAQVARLRGRTKRVGKRAMYRSLSPLAVPMKSTRGRSASVSPTRYSLSGEPGDMSWPPKATIVGVAGTAPVFRRRVSAVEYARAWSVKSSA